MFQFSFRRVWAPAFITGPRFWKRIVARSTEECRPCVFAGEKFEIVLDDVGSWDGMTFARAGRIKRDSVLLGDEQDLHASQRLHCVPGTRLQGEVTRNMFSPNTISICFACLHLLFLQMFSKKYKNMT